MAMAAPAHVMNSVFFLFFFGGIYSDLKKIQYDICCVHHILGLDH